MAGTIAWRLSTKTTFCIHESDVVRVFFLTENTHCGGLDTFITSLVNNWPHPDDELTIICNQSHPGCAVIERNLLRACRVIRHSVRLYPEMALNTKAPVLRSGRRLLSPILKYAFFTYYVLAFGRMLRHSGADRLMVINGGHPGGDSCRAAIIAWALFKKNKPFAVYNFHNLAVKPRWFERWQETLIDRLLGKFSKKLIAVSQACARSMENRPAFDRSNCLIYIYNGISAAPVKQPLSSCGIRMELGIPESSPVCLMLATYEPRKGHEFLLRAFEIVLTETPNTHLVICGFGYPDEIAHVQSLVERLDLFERVHLCEFRNDTATLLKQANVLLVPSQEFESFGLTSVEAMAQSVPVVATRVGGIPEVVENYDGGVCVAPNDIEGFARNIIRFLQDGEYAKTQGRKGHQRYLRLFTVDRMAKQYAEIVRQV